MVSRVEIWEFRTTWHLLLILLLGAQKVSDVGVILRNKATALVLAPASNLVICPVAVVERASSGYDDTLEDVLARHNEAIQWSPEQCW